MTMHRHEAVNEQLGEYLLGHGTPDARREIEQHLAECAACATEASELALVLEGLARVPEVTSPPPHLKERVLASLRGLPAPDRQLQSVQPMPPPRNWNMGWLAAAAALVLALGGALYLSNQRAADAAGRLARAETEIDALRSRIDTFTGQTDLALSILTASDMQRVELAGSVSGARAYWSASRGLLLAADELPVPPAGRVYQVWLIGGGAPVSAGILGTPRTGRGMLIVPPPSGINRGPVTIAVTDEPPGGLPAPTGSKHLVGSV